MLWVDNKNICNQFSPSLIFILYTILALYSILEDNIGLLHSEKGARAHVYSASRIKSSTVQVKVMPIVEPVSVTRDYKSL